MATRFEYECCICADTDRDDREVVSIIVRAGDAIGHLLSSSIEASSFSSKNDGGSLNPAISCSLILDITGNSVNSSIGTHSTAISCRSGLPGNLGVLTGLRVYWKNSFRTCVEPYVFYFE